MSTNSTKRVMYDRDGNILPEGSVLPDGGYIRTSVMMMDAAERRPSFMLADSGAPVGLAGHAPGSVKDTEANLDAKAAALDARDKRLADAWRNPPSVEIKAPVKDAATIPAAPTADAIEAMHAKREQRLRDAYKMGA